MNTRLPAAQRRRQLLDVAIALFGKGGYSEASMSDIAAAAGITKPVVYQHFASKRTLFLEVLAETGRRMQDAVIEATATAEGPREQVAAGFSAYMAYLDENPGSFSILFSDASRSDLEFGAEVHRVESLIANHVAEYIVIEGLSETERRALANGLVGLAEGIYRYWVEADTGLSSGRVAELLTELAWSGLRGAG